MGVSKMSHGDVSEFRAGLTWSFPAERLNEVVDAIALLPDGLQDACVYATGTVEFDLEVQAQSLEDARRIVIERVLTAVTAAGLVGQPVSISVTDDASWTSWQWDEP